MLDGRARFWLGAILLAAGAAVLFGSLFVGDGTPVVLAVGVVVLAAGTLLVALARRGRPV